MSADRVAAVRFGPDGLVPAVVQDATDGTVLMVAWMNREALDLTLAGPLATFWSRSRQALWVKGETSGNVQRVVAVATDCDADTVLVTVRPDGPACHTGARSCFFEPLTADAAPPRAGEVLAGLAATIAARRGADPGSSWTARLLDGGPPVIGAKLREEAGELAAALAGETDDRVAAEAADLVYHLLVGLAARGVSLEAVAAELRRREGTSGIEEKQRRGGGDGRPRRDGP